MTLALRPELYSDDQLDELDALSAYFVMLWAKQEYDASLAKHANHDQKSHGNWAVRSDLAELGFRRPSSGAGPLSWEERLHRDHAFLGNWNPEGKTVAERMVGVTSEALLYARKYLAKKWEKVRPEKKLDPEAAERRERFFDEAALRRSYMQRNIQPMPPATKRLFEQLKQNYHEIANTFPYTTEGVYEHLMEGYAEDVGLPVEVATREFRSMRQEFDPLGLFYPELSGPYGWTIEKGKKFTERLRAEFAARRMQDAAARRAKGLRRIATVESAMFSVLDNPAPSRPPEKEAWEEYIARRERLRESERKKEDRKKRFYEFIDRDGDGIILEGTPLERRVGKHARHDQQSHGNWARGRSAYAGGELLPPRDKLDEEGQYSPEANMLATQLRRSQEEHEPAITKLMDTIAVDTGGMLEGIGFRMKTTSSLARKIDLTSIEDGISRQEAAQNMKDVLRYTFKFTERQYTQRVNDVYEAMAAQGFVLVNSKNYWELGDAYDGLNANFMTPQGFLIEVQFHTASSLKMKDPSHRLYELYRGDEKALSEIGLTRETVTEAQRKAWWDQMVGMWGEVNRPKGILELPTLTGVMGYEPLAKAAFRYFAKMDAIGQPRAYYRLAKGKSRIVEERWDRTQGRWVDDKNKLVSWWMVSGEPMELEEIPNPGLGNVSTSVKKSKNIPSNPKLYAKVKAEAKRKFDVYPSAYANGWLVQEYKRRGGTYKTVEKQQPTSSDVHVPSTDWNFKRKKKRKKTGLSGMVDKHAQHDQKAHGNWARGGGSPKVSGPTAKRDAHISQYGLMWTDGNEENPDVLAAKRIPDELWRKKPKEMFDPAELHPTEEWIGSRHVDKVVSGREPFREGYDPYVIRDRLGKLWIVDGHHRAAMYAGLGQKMPAHVWDWGMRPDEAISRWEETIKITRRRMNNLSADYPGNEQVQSLERERMAESITQMEAKIKALEAERKKLGLSKHGSHDQSTHGNWARNRRIYNYIAENEGITFDLRGKEHKLTGYAVADPEQAFTAEEKFPASEFLEGGGLEIIRDYTRKWKDELSQPGKFLGAWRDGDLFYLDVATVVESREKAMEMGKETNQLAIYDLGAGESIYIDKASGKCYLVSGSELDDDMLKVLYNKLVSK